MVVPAEFVAQTGSDFDMDSIYTMYYTFNVIDGKPVKINYTNDNEHLEERYIKYVNHNSTSEVIGKLAEERKAAANRSYTAYKRNRDAKVKERNEAARAELVDISANVEKTNDPKFKSAVFGVLNSAHWYGLNDSQKIEALDKYFNDQITYFKNSVAMLESFGYDTKKENQLLDRFLLFSLFTKDSINHIKGLSESADEYANHVKEAMLS